MFCFISNMKALMNNLLLPYSLGSFFSFLFRSFWFFHPFIHSFIQQRHHESLFSVMYCDRFNVVAKLVSTFLYKISWSCGEDRNIKSRIPRIYYVMYSTRAFPLKNDIMSFKFKLIVFALIHLFWWVYYLLNYLRVYTPALLFLN